MAVRFGREVTEAPQDVDASGLLLADLRVRFHGLQQEGQHVLTLVGHLDVPRLVVDAHAAEIDLLWWEPERLGDQLVSALDAVAEPDEAHPSRAPGRPGVHGHRIRVVQKERIRGDVAHVRTDVQDDRNGAQGVEHPARAQRVRDALVDSVLERDLDVMCESLEAADTGRANDIISADDRFPTVHRVDDGRRQAVVGDHLARQVRHHAQVLGTDVHEAELGVRQFGYRQDVRHQPAGKANAARPDHRHLHHGQSFLISPSAPSTANGRQVTTV